MMMTIEDPATFGWLSGHVVQERDENLDLAAEVARLTGELGDALQSAIQHNERVDNPHRHEPFRRLVENLFTSVLRTKPLTTTPSPELARVVAAIRQVKDILQQIESCVRDSWSSELYELWPDLKTVSKEIWEAIQEVAKSCRSRDPLDFLDDAGPEVSVTESNDPQLSPSAELGDERSRGKPVLSVNMWSDLAIGIDQHWNYYAFTPPDLKGAVVKKEKGIRLDLRGKQWKMLLNELSKSEDGRSVPVQVLINLLGSDTRSLVERERRARSMEIEAAHRAELTSKVNPSRRWLQGLVSDLSRKLGKQVSGPKGKGQAAISLNEGNVQAGFVTRALVPDSNRLLRFGDP